MATEKKKKDFKLPADLVREFERLVPSGKQTALIESLIEKWICEKKKALCKEEIRRAYERDTSRPRSKT